MYTSSESTPLLSASSNSRPRQRFNAHTARPRGTPASLGFFPASTSQALHQGTAASLSASEKKHPLINTRSNMACCFQCIPNAEIGVIERLGKYQGLAQPGFTCILWPLDSIVAKLSTRVQQLDVRMETKTKDNVFVTAVVSVQYQPIKSKIYDAFYRLTDPQAQIRSYVYDVVRSTLPKLDLDQAFDSKEDIAIAVKNQLEEVMQEYGYQILQALVTDMDPDARVKGAMNEINASKRLREAATNKAEADKIMQVKAAEAEAESKYLSGVGVSRQRKAIVDGLRDSVQTFSETIDGTSPKDVMDLLLLTQYFDMLRDVGQSSRAATVFLPHAPQSVATLQGAMRDGFMQGQAGSEGLASAQMMNR
ncbi:unnamed protein product [Ectocarpus sp. 6 AP-2014]